jgi:hypothetical protein
MNYTIGWFGRDFSSFFLPIWFLVVFFLYKKLNDQKVIFPSSLIWMHILISIIPSFSFCDKYIYSLYDFEKFDSIEKVQDIQLFINKVYGYYVLVQIIIVAYLYSKFQKNINTTLK